MGDKASGRHTIQQRETKKGDNGRQGETRRMADILFNKGKQEGTQGRTRPWEGGHTIQHRHTCGETMGDNGRQWRQGRQDLEKADTPSNTGTHVGETMGDKGRQDIGNPTQAHMWGGQWETMGHTIQHRHTCGETMRGNGRQRETMGKYGRQWETRGDKTSGRRTHHPTQAHMWGDNERQREATGDNGRQGETRPREVDTPSNTGKHVRGDKTSGRRTHHPTPRQRP